MKIRTLSDLSSRLRGDLAWRRKELVTFRGLVDSSAAAKKQALLRGAVAVLYAHWEGFVKTGARDYLTFVKSKRLALSELADCFVALAARSRLHNMQESKKAVLHATFITWFLSEWPKRAQLPPETVVDAESNLSVDVFKNILALIGVPYRPEYAVREKPVIERLLEIRNELAHGEWRTVDASDYESLQSETDRLMVWFCDDVEAAAITGTYKRRARVALGK